MPIEIRELVIRATVDPSGSAADSFCGPKSKDSTKSSSRSYSAGDDDTVQACVREVLRILADKRER